MGTKKNRVQAAAPRDRGVCSRKASRVEHKGPLFPDPTVRFELMNFSAKQAWGVRFQGTGLGFGFYLLSENSSAPREGDSPRFLGSLA